MVNGRDKKHQPHNEQDNLKRCEIKQLPNCWPGKPFKVSRFSPLFLPFLSFFSGVPICLPKCVRPFLPRFSRKESQPRRIICPERFSRFLLSSLSVFFSWPRHHLLVHGRLCTRHPFFLYPSLALFALCEIRSWKDLIRPDTTETSAGSQLRDYPADPFRLDAVLQIPFPTGCAAYLSIGPTTFRSDDQKRSGNPTRPANMTVIFRREAVIFRASNTMKLDYF